MNGEKGLFNLHDIADKDHNARFIRVPDGEDHIKRCPQCKSLFITDLQCDSCGLQLTTDLLGDPFGEKSFYSIKESYWAEKSGMIRAWHGLERKDSKCTKRYVRRLGHRYEILLDFFLYKGQSNPRKRSYEESDQQIRNWFLVEIQDLIRELIQYHVSSEMLWDKLSNMEDHPLYAKIAAWILHGEKNRESLNWLENFYSYRLYNLVSLGFLLSTLLTFMTIIMGAMFFFHQKSY